MMRNGLREKYLWTIVEIRDMWNRFNICFAGDRISKPLLSFNYIAKNSLTNQRSWAETHPPNLDRKTGKLSSKHFAMYPSVQKMKRNGS
jgi:hypothetical protein